MRRRIRGALREAVRGQGGFTLIEMVTVFLVIGILTALILANTLTGDRRQELRDNAAQFVNLVRNAEARAAAAEPVGGTSRNAYGICVTSTTATDGNGTFPRSRCAPPQGQVNAYQLYARTKADTEADPGLSQRPVNPHVFSSHALPGDIVFLFAGNLYLDFIPPQPTMFVNGVTGNRVLYVYSAKANYFRIIQLRPKSGAVYVQ